MISFLFVRSKSTESTTESRTDLFSPAAFASIDAHAAVPQIPAFRKYSLEKSALRYEAHTVSVKIELLMSDDRVTANCSLPRSMLRAYRHIIETRDTKKRNTHSQLVALPMTAD